MFTGYAQQLLKERVPRWEKGKPRARVGFKVLVFRFKENGGLGSAKGKDEVDMGRGGWELVNY